MKEIISHPPVHKASIFEEISSQTAECGIVVRHPSKVILLLTSQPCCLTDLQRTNIVEVSPTLCCGGGTPYPADKDQDHYVVGHLTLLVKERRILGG